jgi:hypothetical protein
MESMSTRPDASTHASATRRRALPGAALAALAFAALACSSPGKVDSEPKSDVFLLTPSYSVQENLGQGPVAVDSDANLARFRVDQADGSSEFLLALFPDKLDGTLLLKLSKSERLTETEASGSYFDRLLRAHRLVLKGDLDGAQKLIDRLENEFDVGYGTSVLAGNIAILRGDGAKARRHFDYAKNLLPDATPPGTAVDVTPSAGGTP